MILFLKDLWSMALFETWAAAGVAFLLLLGAFCFGLLAIPSGHARPFVRALAGVPLFILVAGVVGIAAYLLGMTTGGSLLAVLVLAVGVIGAALLYEQVRPLLVVRELLPLASLLAIGFLLAFFGWGEHQDGTIRSMSGAWGDGALHTLIAEAFAHRRGPDLSMPAFAGESLREPFGYDFVAAMLRRAGLTIGGAFTLPAAGLLAALCAWAGHGAQRLGELRAPEGHRSVEQHRGARLTVSPQLFAMLVAGVLIVAFGGFQWAIMASETDSWSPSQFFGVHERAWDKVEDRGLIWANHLNTLLSQKHLLLAAAFLVVLMAILLEQFRAGGDAGGGPAAPRTVTEGSLLKNTSDVTVARVGPSGWGIGADRRRGGTHLRQGRPQLALLAIATGLLPLFHVHAFLAAMLLWSSAALVARSKNLAVLAALAVVISAPTVIWQSGLFQREGFLSFAPAWMADGGPLGWVWFWLVNLGVFLPLVAISLTRLWVRDRAAAQFLVMASGVLFLLGNLVQFQPYRWDNFKVFLIAWLVLLPAAVAELASWRFRGGRMLASLLVLLMSLTTISELRTHIHFRSTYPVYAAADRAAGRLLDQRLPRSAVVLGNTDTRHNHPLTLTGRTLAAGYGGWLWTRGYPWEERLSFMDALRSSPRDRFCVLAKELGITHVVYGLATVRSVEELCTGLPTPG